jgi:hypothetical protein
MLGCWCRPFSQASPTLTAFILQELACLRRRWVSHRMHHTAFASKAAATGDWGEA